MKIVYTAVTVLTMLSVAGCSSTGDSKDSGVVVEDHSDSALGGYEGGAGAASSSGISGYGELSIEELNDPGSPLARRVIYFAYDSSEVAEEDRELVSAHAALLATNPQIHVSVEGHSDERGAREYNVGLADRRAQSVRRMLEFQGVSPDQLSVVSYGEEKPAVEGYDETAWSQNRRVELVYVGY